MIIIFNALIQSIHIKAVSALFSTSFVTFVHSSYALLLQQQPIPMEGSEDLLDRFTGPFGALILSVIGLYICGKFINTLMKRNKEQEEEIKSVLKDQIEFFEKNRRS